MTATENTRAAGNEAGDAPTTAQTTTFDARDTLAGDLDDTTVWQAVEGGSPGSNPTPRGVETRFRKRKTADSAEAGR